MKAKFVLAILAIGAVAGGVAYWKMSPARQQAGREKYDRVRVVRGDIVITVQSTANIRPRNRLEIKPPISGRVDEVLVREGEQVKTGQIIAWMSSTDRAALLDAARARGPEEMEHWKEIYRATPLMAPLDGTIIARDVEPGQTVTEQDTLLVLSDVLIVEAQVDETDLAQIRNGQGVVVILDAYPDQGFGAEVSHISYEAETVENVTIYKVEVQPTNLPEFVRSGMTASVTFTARAATNILILAAAAVREEAGKKGVLKPDPRNPGEPVFQPVTVGQTDGRNYEIKAGLEEGAEVLTPRIQASQAEGPARNNPFMPFGGGRGGRRPAH